MPPIDLMAMTIVTLTPAASDRVCLAIEHTINM
jgi:hypothetical protein